MKKIYLALFVVLNSSVALANLADTLRREVFASGKDNVVFSFTSMNGTTNFVGTENPNSKCTLSFDFIRSIEDRNLFNLVMYTSGTRSSKVASEPVKYNYFSGSIFGSDGSFSFQDDDFDKTQRVDAKRKTETVAATFKTWFDQNTNSLSFHSIISTSKGVVTFDTLYVEFSQDGNKITVFRATKNIWYAQKSRYLRYSDIICRGPFEFKMELPDK